MKTRKRLVQKSYRFEEELMDEVEIESEVRKKNGVKPASQQAIINEALRFYFEYLRENPPLRKAS